MFPPRNAPCAEEDFRLLMERAGQGDAEAARLLVARYEPEIRRFIRIRLTDSRLRRVLDSVDVCQSILARFFARLRAGALAVQSPRELVRLLCVMARNRLLDHVRREQSQRRGRGATRCEEFDLERVADPTVNPSELAARTELVDVLRAHLAADARSLVEQRLAGRDWSELVRDFGGTTESLRKQFTRAIDRAARESGLLEENNGNL